MISSIHLARLGMGLALLAASNASWSAQVAIAYYDIVGAVLTGHGNWHHTYNGTITPDVNFTNFTVAGTTANYQLGSGTLNDGVIGFSTNNSVSGGTSPNTQLFVTPSASDGTPITPVIFLTLDTSQPWLVNRVEIYGGDNPVNSIPGAITSVDVGVIGPGGGDPGTTFATTAFGPTQNIDGIFVNDLVDLSGSALALTPAWALVLSNFQGTVANWFSITEIKVYGEPVPLPPSVWLMGSALATLVGLARRRIA